MLEAARLYLFVFGGLTVAGGVVGFVKAKSTPSLIAGGVAGGLLVAAGWLVGTHPTAGLVLGLGLSAALAGRFVTAYRKGGKIMPAGMMAGLSVLGGAVTVAALAFG
jgi:uncharacterized membrane protein (UPF0136 family)